MRAQDPSLNLASIDWSTCPKNPMLAEIRQFIIREGQHRAGVNSQDDSHSQEETAPLPPTFDKNPEVKQGETEEEREFWNNARGQGEGTSLPSTLGSRNPEAKREESDEEGEVCKVGGEEECEEGCQECAEGCPECGEGCPEYTEGCLECEGCQEYESGYPECEEWCPECRERCPVCEEGCQECEGCGYEEGCEVCEREDSGGTGEKGFEEDSGLQSKQESGQGVGGIFLGCDEDDKKVSEQETGEYAPGYEDYDEAIEEYVRAADFASSHEQLKHRTPSSGETMGTSVNVENQKPATLRYNHCQGSHRKSNCPELPCSHYKVEGHVSPICPGQLTKVRKNKNTEMWIRRQLEAEELAPVASGGTTCQPSEEINADNPRKRKSRASPAIPTSSNHESVSNDHCDLSPPEANQDNDDELQDFSTSVERPQVQEEKPIRPMQCSNCKGPHRKRVCPQLPCAHCKEGHISSTCPERLLQQQKTRSTYMTMWRKRENGVGDKGKTGGDISNGVGSDSNSCSDHEKTNSPRLRCSVCRGPHRKPVCPNLPCAYCEERGHVRHDCPKRLADREELKVSNKRQRTMRKKEKVILGGGEDVD